LMDGVQSVGLHKVCRRSGAAQAGTASAAAEALPTWEMMGMPITSVKIQVLAAVGIRELSPPP
jgi:hypothetical protein